MPKKTEPTSDEPAQRTETVSTAEMPGTTSVTVQHGDAEYTYEVYNAAADDFELLDDLARLDEGDLSRLPRILRRLIGRDQIEDAMDRLRDPDSGRVTRAVAAEFVFKLIKGFSGNF